MVATLFKPLLEAQTSPELDEAIKQLETDLKVFAREEKIGLADVKKVGDLTGIKFNGNLKNLLAVGREDDYQNLRKKWSLPDRNNIERTTNHSEGLHGKINEAVKSRWTLARRVSVIITLITKSAGSFLKRLGGGAIHKRMRELYNAAKSDSITAADECECWAARRNAALYGTDPFCVHTCKGKQTKKLPVALHYEVPDEMKFGETLPMNFIKAPTPWNKTNSPETRESRVSKPVAFQEGAEPALAQLISDVAYFKRIR